MNQCRRRQGIHYYMANYINEGLKCSLIKSSIVSGASEYQQLCIAAKNEERRQSELLR